MLCATLLKGRNDGLLKLSLTPIFGLGFVYLIWMTIASFSSYAPMLTLFIAFFFTLLPPRLHIIQITRQALSSLLTELHGKKLIYFAIFILQLVLIFLISNELSNTGNSTWLTTIFDGLPLWIYPCIFTVFAITIGLTFCNSRLWIISLFVLSFWAKAFMLHRGFIHFGGDDGENIAVVKFLVNGGKTPFLDLNLYESYWNWRYGSFLTLFFQSNMAFVSFVTMSPPDFSAGVMANVISTVLLLIGSYALLKSTLKNKFAYRLALIFIMIFNTADFWWQFRFDPNLLTHTLFISYVTTVILLPNSKKGFAIFIVSSFVMFLTHPTALGLILPCAIYKIVVIISKFSKKELTLDKKHVLICVLCVVSIMLAIIFIPILSFSLTRLFSASHLFGLSSGQSLRVGNFIYKSSLVNHYFAKYTLLFSFVLIGVALLSHLWSILKLRVSNEMNALIVISFVIIAELSVLDLFVDADPFPAWRLISLVPTLLIPIIFLLFDTLNIKTLEKNVLLSRNRFSELQEIFPKILTLLIVSMLITISFIQTAYPSERFLNLDTISAKEYELLYSLTTINLNQSLILAESPTWRYIMGIIGDWPPKTATYYSRSDDWPAIYSHSSGEARIKAFEDFAYNGKSQKIVDLAIKENITTVYIVILNRYAAIKSVDWHEGRPYVKNLQSFGKVYFINQAGYILELRISDFRAQNVPLTDWEVTESIGASDPVLEVRENVLEIGANFSGRYQILRVTRELPFLNLTEYDFLSIQYKGDNHSGSPHLRVFLRDSNNTHAELLPVLFSCENFTTVTYCLQNLPIKNAVSIELSLDSGSPATQWPGPGQYIYYIKEIVFTTFPL